MSFQANQMIPSRERKRNIIFKSVLGDMSVPGGYWNYKHGITINIKIDLIYSMHRICSNLEQQVFVHLPPLFAQQHPVEAAHGTCYSADVRHQSSFHAVGTRQWHCCRSPLQQITCFCKNSAQIVTTGKTITWKWKTTCRRPSILQFSRWKNILATKIRSWNW